MRRAVMLSAALAAAVGLPMALTISDHRAIWVARPKRGSRRNRSRWDYNR